ncbi:MAG: monovalent cation/H(+) antiporter subunit G [Clostridia bacterium]|mgnify:CR=1 FL=1|nr:monovalent cation/H(+) antiporter subunit G [Clostridia bacterium]
MEFIGAILLILGCLYIGIAALGVLRFPDFYSRLHASGGAETLGMFLSISGLILIEGFTQTSLKLLIIVVFILLANPIGTHTISRAAYRSGLKPWTKKGE